MITNRSGWLLELLTELIMIIKIGIRVFMCACFISTYCIGCCTDYTMVGKCTVDGNNNKEDKTREEADMTPSPFFPKSSKVAQNCPKVS